MMGKDLGDAINILADKFKQDGYYKETWISKISIQFRDEFEMFKNSNPDTFPTRKDLFEISNRAAERFLDRLINITEDNKDEQVKG